jgi:hypothetical protein
MEVGGLGVTLGDIANGAIVCTSCILSIGIYIYIYYDCTRFWDKMSILYVRNKHEPVILFALPVSKHNNQYAGRNSSHGIHPETFHSNYRQGLSCLVRNRHFHFQTCCLLVVSLECSLCGALRFKLFIYLGERCGDVGWGTIKAAL